MSRTFTTNQVYRRIGHEPVAGWADEMPERLPYGYAGIPPVQAMPIIDYRGLLPLSDFCCSTCGEPFIEIPTGLLHSCLGFLK